MLIKTHTLTDIYVNTDISCLTSSIIRSASSGAIQPVRTGSYRMREPVVKFREAADKIASFTFCFLRRKEVSYKQN